MSLKYFSLGALALAQASPASAFDDFESGFASVAPAVSVATAAGEALEARATSSTSSSTRSAYPTSFSAIPTDNAGYSAMTASQHSKFCASAKTTAAGYSRACIDNIWDSLYGRSVAPEDMSLEARAAATTTPRRSIRSSSRANTTTSSPFSVIATSWAVPVPTDNAGWQAMTHSQHLEYCATAQPTENGYSRACIDNIWDNMWARSAASEEQTTTDAAAKPAATTTEAGWEHFNFNRNVYLSSLRTACPSATEEVVKEKCSAISSWYAEHSMSETAAPSVPSMILPRRPTTFATVTTRGGLAVEDEDVEEMEKRGQWNNSNGNGNTGSAPSGGQGKGQGEHPGKHGGSVPTGGQEQGGDGQGPPFGGKDQREGRPEKAQGPPGQSQQQGGQSQQQGGQGQQSGQS